jgi:hypothetical protein
MMRTLIVVDPLNVDALLSSFENAHKLLEPVEIAGANLLLIHAQQLTKHDLDIAYLCTQSGINLSLHVG